MDSEGHKYQIPKAKAECLKVLGLQDGDYTKDELNNAKKKELMKFHSDKFNHYNDKNFTKLAEEKSKQLNATYDFLIKKRFFKAK